MPSLPYITNTRPFRPDRPQPDMPVYKTDKADIRSRYQLYVQIGLALSLLLIIGAFTIPLMPGDDF